MSLFLLLLHLTVTPFFKQEKRREQKRPPAPPLSSSLTIPVSLSVSDTAPSMPSIVVSDPVQSSENSKSKTKEKKMKAKVQLEAERFESPASDKKHKKEKKSSKSSESKLLEHQEAAKKEKKRKALEPREDDDEDKSETSSELVDPENLKGKKKKKARLSDGEDEVVQQENPNAVSNFRISDSLRLKLKDNGIESLFPIQAMTFNIVFDGSDLVGRARTGQV